MKVLVIHTTYKLKGGEDTVVANEAALLTSAGVEVELLTFSNTGNVFLKVLNAFFNRASYLKTQKKIAAFKPDVVHIHNLHFGGSPSVIYAIKKYNVPIVHTLHNYRILCPSATLFYDNKIFLDSLYQSFPLSAVTKGVYLNSKPLTFWMGSSMYLHHFLRTWKNVSKFIALGEYTKIIFSKSKLKSIEDNIIVKPNFCYESPSNVQSAGQYYLYVGRLSIEKGLVTLLDAFSRNKMPLKIAGGGPMESMVREYSCKFSNIQFLGSVDKEEVTSLLKHATALIFPSQWYETFGMVIIEAFAAGTPVIASNLGQLKFTINDGCNGLHFEAGSSDDLQKKVNFYQNLPLSQKLSYRINALNTHKDYYSPEKNAGQLINIYHSAINKKVAGN